MIGLVPHQLQSEISFHRCADVRGPTVVDRPATVFILMTEDVVRALLKTFLVSCPQKRVHEDVIGFKRAVGFEFAAPVALFVLLREEPVARTVNSGGHAAGKVINFPEAELWSRRSRNRGGEFVHTLIQRP